MRGTVLHGLGTVGASRLGTVTFIVEMLGCYPRLGKRYEYFGLYLLRMNYSEVRMAVDF